MKLWIAAAVIVAVVGCQEKPADFREFPRHPLEVKVVNDSALESRVTALEVEVRRLARDRAKECGRMR
jgi:hypothetical protein